MRFGIKSAAAAAAATMVVAAPAGAVERVVFTGSGSYVNPYDYPRVSDTSLEPGEYRQTITFSEAGYITAMRTGTLDIAEYCFTGPNRTNPVYCGGGGTQNNDITAQGYGDALTFNFSILASTREETDYSVLFITYVDNGITYLRDAPGDGINPVFYTNTIVQLNGVPEPASWAMMIAGVAIAGGALRRKAPERRPALV